MFTSRYSRSTVSFLNRFKHSTTHVRMSISPSVQSALNSQINLEAEASQLYLSWASWAEVKGLPGVASFFYAHSEEERQHMIKMIRYLNKRGGQAIIPSVQEISNAQYNHVLPLFQDFLREEEKVTHSINELIHECVQNKDYITHDFLQWFAAEQIQEESLVKDILDRLNLIGDDKGGMYTFDRDIMNFRKENST